MSNAAWIMTLGIIYAVLVVTLAVLTFKRGHWILGLIGFVFPILWIIGCILPDKRKSYQNPYGGQDPSEYQKSPHTNHHHQKGADKSATS